MERARSARDMLQTMVVFFGTSFNQQMVQNENMVRLLEDLEEKKKFQEKLMAERDIDTSKKLGDLTAEIRTLRQEGAREREEREARRLKKKSIKKRPLKDCIEFEDIIGILKETENSVKRDCAPCCRDRICIILLYIYGIRVAELKEIHISQIYDFLDKKTI